MYDQQNNEICAECYGVCDPINNKFLLAACRHIICVACFTNNNGCCSSCQISREGLYQEPGVGWEVRRYHWPIPGQYASSSADTSYSYPQTMNEAIFKMNELYAVMWGNAGQVNACLMQNLPVDYWKAYVTAVDVLDQIAVVKKEMLHLALDPFLSAYGRMEQLQSEARNMEFCVAREMNPKRTEELPMTVLDMQVRQKFNKIQWYWRRPERLKKISSDSLLRTETTLYCSHGTFIPSTTPIRKDDFSIICCDGITPCIVGELRSGMKWILADCLGNNELHFFQVPDNAGKGTTVRCQRCQRRSKITDISEGMLATRIVKEIQFHQPEQPVPLNLPMTSQDQKNPPRYSQPTNPHGPSNAVASTAQRSSAVGTSKTGLVYNTTRVQQKTVRSNPVLAWERAKNSGTIVVRSNAPKSNKKRKNANVLNDCIEKPARKRNCA